MITINANLANAIWAFMVEQKFKDVAHILVPFQSEVGPQMEAMNAKEDANEVVN